MPRIIVFLLTIAALAILTLQNLATEVPLVILGKTFASAMPLGLLLLLTVGIGALLTLVFYGLVGSRRPPESKYKPMGRRVPYPDSPSSNPLPTSNPSSDASFKSSSTGRSSSSAFVSEPANEPSPSEPKTSEPPFVSPPQDRPVTDTPSSDRNVFSEPPNTYFSPNESPYSSSDEPRYSRSPRNDESPYRDSTYGESAYEDSAYRDSPNNDSARAGKATASAFVQQPIAGLKSVFGKKKDRKNDPDESEKPIGDDWGQRRTKEHINSWDASGDEPSKLEEGAKNLFNFGRNVGANAGRLAEDIASGWNSPDAGARANDSNAPRYGEAGYGESQYNELDQGWENFDDYGEPPPREGIADKRTYGDSLYDDYDRGNDDGLDRGYNDDAYADDIGPDGVYDADYKVIVPPSKPLPDEPLPPDPRGDDDGDRSNDDYA